MRPEPAAPPLTPGHRRRVLGSFLCVIALAGAACRTSATEPLGLPDSYLVMVPSYDDVGHLRRGPTGLPVLETLALEDSRGVPLHRLFAIGFGAELLRTDYLRKQFVRDAKLPPAPTAATAQAKASLPGGGGANAAALAAAAQPTLFVLGGDGFARTSPLGHDTGAGSGLATRGFFGGAAEHPGVPWIALAAAPEDDAALAQTVSGRLGRSIATALATGGAPAGPGADGTSSEGPALPEALIAGYAHAMEVIAREWRVGEGPRGTLPSDAGTGTQRELFASVRQNRYVMRPGEGTPQLRSGADMLREPGVAATVLYRMAQSKAIGHRIAPADIYAPFVNERVPPGVSPAAVLGPFRNFQAKLITAWSRAVLRGTPPRDIADLVALYAALLPAERSEVIRLFVVTTYGATVKEGGVPAALAGGAAVEALPELTALAAEVAAGRRSLRAAVDPAPVNTDK